MAEVHGTVGRDLQTVWYLAMAVTLPPGYALLESWLAKRPSDELIDTWEAYIKALVGQLSDEQNRLLKNQIVGFAKMVAAAAGGFLGIGKVSASEEKVLHRIESAFAK